MPNNIDSVFITFEGIDGSGKTTQAKLLYNYLQKKNYRVLLTCEPGGSNLGKQIRSLLIDPQQKNIDARAEALLYAADRAQHIAEIIAPALAKNQIVICDRYTDSTIAYQGYGRSLDLNFLKQLNILATNNLEPDLTFYISLKAATAKQRVEKRAFEDLKTVDRIEKESLNFYSSVAGGFDILTQENPERIQKINGEEKADVIAKEIENIIDNFLSSKLIKQV